MKDVFMEHRTQLFMLAFMSALMTHAISIGGMNIFAVILIVLTVLMWFFILTSMCLSLLIEKKKDEWE